MADGAQVSAALISCLRPSEILLTVLWNHFGELLSNPALWGSEHLRSFNRPLEQNEAHLDLRLRKGLSAFVFFWVAFEPPHRGKSRL